MRLVHPGAPGIGPEKNHLEDAAALLPVAARALEGVLEFLVQDLQNARQLALLLRRQMIEAGLHHGGSEKGAQAAHGRPSAFTRCAPGMEGLCAADRKSTRLNSSH